MGLAITTLIVSPLIGLAFFIGEYGSRYAVDMLMTGIIVGIITIVISSLLQYIVFGKLHPFYLFKETETK
jgi:hypothetical protein